MLLEFKVSNFKSFKDEMVFSMVPAPKIKDIPYSILTKKSGKNIFKSLSSAVIYGPNAAGKTNIISAMELLRDIVVNGNIEIDKSKSSTNPALKKLEFIPNINNTENVPVIMSIKFLHNSLLVEYSLSIEIGCFADTDFNKKIVYESLIVNSKKIFERKEKISVSNVDAKWQNAGFDQKVSANMAGNVKDNELFLTTYFKVLYSSEMVDCIIEWFTKLFTIIYTADSLKTVPKLPDSTQEKVFIDSDIQNASKGFGIGGENIGYVKSEKSEKPECMSIITRKSDNLSVVVPAKLFESYGTLRFINIYPLILNCLKNGGTIVIDEFDASIHPMALMSIINVFHNDEINVNGAQLIFNTHNPIFLNRNVFRRDEIKFVERDEETGYSTHYSLSDFGTSGENGVRNSADYMKNYFINQYGAIRDIDFSDIIIKAMHDNENKHG